MFRPMLISAAIATTLIVVSMSDAQTDWNNVPYLSHNAYQEVNTDGSPAYNGGFPFRMVGVVLNNAEDWLDPSPGYTAGYVPYNLGGEAEFFFQAVDLDGTLWDSDPGSDFDDAGGSAVWIGQNYGNLPFKADPIFNYTDAQWTAELGRLGLFGGDGVAEPLRAGDLIEVRARGGLHYAGKYNVNEQHSLSTDLDFEIVVLERGFGLPDAEPITLSDLKLADDTFIFDPARITGGERYQSSLVELRDVWIESEVDWTADTDITVTDGICTFNIHLGLNAGFDGTELFTPGESFNVRGILDQAASDGTYSTDGYQLLVMNPGDLAAAQILGDFNKDGFVGIEDINIVLGNWNLTVPMGDLSFGDGSGDGFVGIEDLNIILGNWNTGTPPVDVAVPEPVACMVIAVGFVALGGRRSSAG